MMVMGYISVDSVYTINSPMPVYAGLIWVHSAVLCLRQVTAFEMSISIEIEISFLILPQSASREFHEVGEISQTQI